MRYFIVVFGRLAFLFKVIGELSVNGQSSFTKR